MKKIFLILLVAFSFSRCEKDDICDGSTVTTPKLVIDFYDRDNPTLLKAVTNLSVGETGNPIGYGLFNAVSEIKIPLKSNVTDTNTNSTKYTFIINYSSPATVYTKTDNIEFDYTTSQLFVSRACGYKMVFNLTNSNSNLYTATPDSWIDHIVIAQPAINNENEKHIKIYF